MAVADPEPEFEDFTVEKQKYGWRLECGHCPTRMDLPTLDTEKMLTHLERKHGIDPLAKLFM